MSVVQENGKFQQSSGTGMLYMAPALFHQLNLSGKLVEVLIEYYISYKCLFNFSMLINITSFHSTYLRDGSGEREFFY